MMDSARISIASYLVEILIKFLSIFKAKEDNKRHLQLNKANKINKDRKNNSMMMKI